MNGNIKLQDELRNFWWRKICKIIHILWPSVKFTRYLILNSIIYRQVIIDLTNPARFCHQRRSSFSYISYISSRYFLINFFVAIYKLRIMTHSLRLQEKYINCPHKSLHLDLHSVESGDPEWLLFLCENSREAINHPDCDSMRQYTGDMGTVWAKGRRIIWKWTKLRRFNSHSMN